MSGDTRICVGKKPVTGKKDQSGGCSKKRGRGEGEKWKGCELKGAAVAEETSKHAQGGSPPEPVERAGTLSGEEPERKKTRGTRT